MVGDVLWGTQLNGQGMGHDTGHGGGPIIDGLEAESTAFAIKSPDNFLEPEIKSIALVMESPDGFCGASYLAK